MWLMLFLVDIHRIVVRGGRCLRWFHGRDSCRFFGRFSIGNGLGLGFCWSRIARTCAAVSGSLRIARRNCRLAGEEVLVVVDAWVDESDSGTSCLVLIVPSS